MTRATNDNTLSPSGMVRATREGRPAYQSAPDRLRQSDIDAAREVLSNPPAGEPTIWQGALFVLAGFAIIAAVLFVIGSFLP